jgi:hypothetical protein
MRRPDIIAIEKEKIRQSDEKAKMLALEKAPYFPALVASSWRASPIA